MANFNFELTKPTMTKADTLRLLLIRIDEWPLDMSGGALFDEPNLEESYSDRLRNGPGGTAAYRLLQNEREGGLDHG